MFNDYAVQVMTPDGPSTNVAYVGARDDREAINLSRWLMGTPFKGRVAVTDQTTGITIIHDVVIR